MSTVISVENLGKKYTISHQNKGDRSSLREVITNGISALGRRILSPFTGRPSSASSQEDFWRLKTSLLKSSKVIVSALSAEMAPVNPPCSRYSHA